MAYEQPPERVEDLYLIYDSGKAWLMGYDMQPEEDAKWWIPISQIVDTDIEEVGDKGYIEIPEWLAVEKGLF